MHPPSPSEIRIDWERGEVRPPRSTISYSLGNRSSVRRVLEYLVVAHRVAPGRAIGADELVSAGWPGQRISPKAAKNRLHVVLNALREVGLRDILHRSSTGGYFLSPHTFVASDGESPTLGPRPSVSLLAMELRAAGMAAKGEPSPLPISSRLAGRTYGEWGAEWARWVFATPLSLNPRYGNRCEHNAAKTQAGPVWFLPSRFMRHGERGVFELAIPHGKYLFVPLMVTVFGSHETGLSDEWELRKLARKTQDCTDYAELYVDDIPMAGLTPTSFRTQSPLFSFTFPEDNVAQFTSGKPAKGGTVVRAVWDSLAAILAPLPVGNHVIRWRANGREEDDGASLQDVEYRIAVH